MRVGRGTKIGMREWEGEGRVEEGPEGGLGQQGLWKEDRVGESESVRAWAALAYCLELWP